MSNRKKKLRPSSAAGLIQSSNIPHILDDLRPSTAIGSAKSKSAALGLEPTYITAHHDGNGLPFNSVYTGRQVHGGVDPMVSALKEAQRRNTIEKMENLTLNEDDSTRRLKRPMTAQHHEGRSVKIEEKITLEDLNLIKEAFENAEKEGTSTLNMKQFKEVFRYFLEMKGADEHQIGDLFMKIDSSADEEIDWDEFCTFMQLEYAEKEESYFRAKEAAFYLPARVENSLHRDTVLSICHASDNTFLTVGQDGLVSFWTPGLNFKRTKQVESGSKKSKWITDFQLMPQYNKFIISTGDREIQFHELSTFEAYCQISGLETVPLRLDYCFTGSDECLLLYGDSQGCISIFIMRNVGELLREWKKMPKVEGIAGIGFDNVISSKNIQFVRWKVHDDWVQELKYYHSIRSVISCSTDSTYSLVIGQTVGSTNVAANIRDVNRGVAGSTLNTKDLTTRRRLPADETVFRIYKGVKTFDFSKIKNILATGGLDRLIRLWNPYVYTKPTGILSGHVTPIIYLFIVEEDNRLFSISTDKTVKVWDIHDQTCLLTVHPKQHLVKGDLTAVHYNPSSRGLALATDHIALLRLKNKPHSMQMTTTHKEGATCCCYNVSFGHVVTASELSVIKVWDVETGNNVFEFSNAHGTNAITCMCFDTTERRLITSGRDGLVKIWNYNNGHCLSTLKPQLDEPNEVCSVVCFNINKNRYVAAVGWDRRINLYSDQQNNLYHVTYPGIRWPDDVPERAHKEDILCVAYSPPHFLATSSYDGEILIWSVKSGRIFSRLLPNDNTSEMELLEGEMSITKIVFLKSRGLERQAASLIANGPQDQVHFWNVYDSKKPYASFSSNHNNLVTVMDVTSDDQLLVTADEKGFVTIWDVSNYCHYGAETKPPEVHSSWRAHIQSVTCVALVKEDCFVLTCSHDCTVRLWTVDGHFVGTLGQPKRWDIYDNDSFQHPMAPYDVVMDPDSIPKHPALEYKDESDSTEKDGDPDSEDGSSPVEAAVSSVSLGAGKATSNVENMDIKELLDSNITDSAPSGKRLRHAKLKLLSKDGPSSQGPSTYKSLKYYELDEVPPGE